MAFSAPQPGDHRTATEPETPVEQPRNPLLVALGAGDAAVAAVARAFADAVEAAASTQKTVQQRVSDLPTELEELRGRFSSEELRRALESYRAQVERAYVEFAGRGEETWERLRERANTDRIARAGQRFTGRAADTVVEASAAAADAVENVGTATAEAIEDAGAETAAATRTATNGRRGAATPRRTPRAGGPASG